MPPSFHPYYIYYLPSINHHAKGQMKYCYSTRLKG